MKYLFILLSILTTNAQAVEQLPRFMCSAYNYQGTAFTALVAARTKGRAKVITQAELDKRHITGMSVYCEEKTQ